MWTRVRPYLALVAQRAQTLQWKREGEAEPQQQRWKGAFGGLFASTLVSHLGNGATKELVGLQSMRPSAWRTCEEDMDLV